MTSHTPPEAGSPRSSSEEPFHPRGALAFMVLMCLFYAAFWFAVYFLMTGRG